MWRLKLLFLLIFIGVSVMECSSDVNKLDKISDDLSLQAAFEAASRALAEIQQRKARGDSVYADCKASNLLYLNRLASIKNPAVTRIVKGLASACQGELPSLQPK